MYQVMVVDDEPMAASLIVNIIKRKYSDFEIMGTAYDGEEALELMEEKGEPDVLITDIQMPVMNGLKLVEETKKRYPEVISVIVSGYQEFEYAKQAIAFGVCDYILKPIVPSEFSKLITRIEEKLRQKYYKERNTLMHKMVNEIPIDEKTLRRYFQSECYYGAIVRLNGLPSRYGERGKKEVFSDINEMMIAYGRDTQETLYLCPGELVSDEDYEQMIRRRIGKEQPEAAYVTSVIRQKSVPAAQIGEMVRELYRKLDSSIILGKNQTLILEETPSANPGGRPGKDYEYLEELLQREIQTADAAEHVFLTKVTELGKNCQKRYGALRKTHMFPKIAAELTEQEQRIIELLAERLSNREIAEKLFLSEGTIKQYINRIYAKLQISGDVRTKRRQLIELLTAE